MAMEKDIVEYFEKFLEGKKIFGYSCKVDVEKEMRLVRILHLLLRETF
jgi:hypothetical protein